MTDIHDDMWEAAPAGDDLLNMSTEDLDEFGRSLQERLVRLKRERVDAVNLERSVNAERARRRQVRLEEAYPERRRIAVLAGERIPEPPATMVTGPSPSSAAVRLSGLSIPVSKAVRVVAPSAPEVEIKGTGVSDHAVVRYLERVLDIDIDHVRSQILTAGVRSAIKAGMSRIRTPFGIVIFREGTITSFLPVDSGPKYTRRTSKGRPAPTWSSRDAEAVDLID